MTAPQPTARERADLIVDRYFTGDYLAYRLAITKAIEDAGQPLLDRIEKALELAECIGPWLFVSKPCNKRPELEERYWCVACRVRKILEG